MKTLLGILVCCLAACGAPSSSVGADPDAGSADAPVSRDAAATFHLCTLEVRPQCVVQYAPDGGRLLFEQNCTCAPSLRCSHDSINFGLCTTP